MKRIDDPYQVLKFVLMTEKCIRMIETENKLSFIVDRTASKNNIAKSFEEVFGSKIDYVKTLIDQKGRKKAFVRLKEAGQAGEIAIKLGII